MARGREQGSISGDLWVPDPVNPRLNRRELLQAGAGLALGAGLAGCGIQRGLSGDTERAIEPTIDGDLVYFNYSQYIDPDLVKAFQEKYDVRVSETYFDSMPAMMAKLQGGNAYDVMFPTAEFVEKLVKSQQLIRLPIEKLENYPNIYSYFNDPWYDPGSEHSVPYSMYLTGMGYRADLVDTMTGSWNDFENEQASGRIYVLDDFQEAIGAANLRNGYDLNTVVEEELQVSRDWLVSLKSNLRGFSVDTITNMSSGNAWIQHLWNGDVINIRYRVENPDDFQFQRSKEGYPVGSDCFVIPVNAEHPGTALLFMDFMLDPKNASQNCQWTGYPMPNKGADSAFAEVAKGDPNIEVTPEDIQTGHEFANLEEQDRILWDQTWVEVKAG